MDSAKQDRLNKLLKLAEQDKLNGNKSITTEKLNNLSEYILKNSNSKFDNYPVRDGPKTSGKANAASDRIKGLLNKNQPAPETPPTPTFSPLLNKYKLPPPKPQPELKKIPKFSKLKNVERTVVAGLETVANLLDNLHLFSKLPMFPEVLVRLLKQTNKLWILILVFLLRKTISQLLNVLRKEKKVNVELGILKSQSKAVNAKLIDSSIYSKYERVLKDLKFDKMMLILELIGNVMDLLFNVIEVFDFFVPDWLMTTLNFSSMFMTIYRMNKDDEYLDDDITEDLI